MAVTLLKSNRIWREELLSSLDLLEASSRLSASYFRLCLYFGHASELMRVSGFSLAYFQGSQILF